MSNSNSTSPRVKSQPQNSSKVYAPEEQHERQFRGTFIPVDLHDLVETKRLSITAAWLITIIDSLSRKRDGCFASNTYLGKRLGKTPRRIEQLLATIEKVGMLESRWEGEQRFLRINWCGGSKERRKRSYRERVRPERNFVPPTKEISYRVEENTNVFSPDKKNTLAQARECERSTTFLSEETQPSTFGQRLAKILITRLSEENKLFRKVTPQSRASWAHQLDLLVKEVQGGEVFVEEIVRDHLDNLRNRFQPECYSAAKIRKRFDELVHARKRRTEENPHSVPEFTERRYQTKDGRTIIECTRTLGASR